MGSKKKWSFITLIIKWPLVGHLLNFIVFRPHIFHGREMKAWLAIITSTVATTLKNGSWSFILLLKIYHVPSANSLAYLHIYFYKYLYMCKSLFNMCVYNIQTTVQNGYFFCILSYVLTGFVLNNSQFSIDVSSPGSVVSMIFGVSNMLPSQTITATYRHVYSSFNVSFTRVYIK